MRARVSLAVAVGRRVSTVRAELGGHGWVHLPGLCAGRRLGTLDGGCCRAGSAFVRIQRAAVLARRAGGVGGAAAAAVLVANPVGIAAGSAAIAAAAPDHVGHGGGGT